MKKEFNLTFKKWRLIKIGFLWLVIMKGNKKFIIGETKHIKNWNISIKVKKKTYKFLA